MPYHHLINCENCGKEHYAAKGGRYCSKACSGQAHSNRLEKICERCGKSIWLKPSEVANGQGRYCSRACRRVADRICEECGKTFHASQYRIDRDGARWCSRQCCDIGRKETVAQRFWRQIEKSDGCWNWAGLRNKFGYGRLTSSGKGARDLVAHRVSWEFHHGQIPNDLCVLHKCDNPPCVNPDHLFLGTKADNNADKVAKDRQARGDQITKNRKQKAARQ